MAIITVKDFPENESERDKIVILSEEKFNEAMKDYSSGEFLLNEDICYLVKRETDFGDNQFIIDLNDSGEFKSGNVLLLNAGRYVPYEQLIKDTASEDYNLLIRICQLMGAKKITCKLSSEKEDKSSTEAKLTADVPNITKVKAGFDKSIVCSVVAEYSSESNFEGSDYKDIEEAERIIKSSRYSNNNEIVELLKLASDTNNKLTSRKLKVTFAENISKKLEVFANIDAEILKQSLGEANFKRLKQSSIVTTFEYEVFF